MKKSTSKGTYNLRQRIRAISGSSQKKTTTIEENYCDQCFRVGNENQVPCELCLQENAENTNTINPPEQEIKNQEPLDADQSESPSILQALNTPSENRATIPRPPAERTDTSSPSSSSDTEERASEESLEENTPVISLPKRPRKLFHNEKEGSSDHLEYDDFIPNCSITSSSEDIPQLSNEMDASKEDISDLQREMVNLQRQMCKQLEAAQVSLSTPHVTESTIVKPTLFHGRENENVDRWLQRFSLYFANGKIPPSSDQAAIKLALHLSGPAETFYYNLPSSVQSSYTLLKDALKERFSTAHRHLRNRQELSKRRQGPTESIEAYLADLNEKLNSLDLRNEDKMCYLIQGLRADIQAEVLKKEPKTYTEAEDTARLIYSIQQSTLQRREEDISRIVQSANSNSTKSVATPEVQSALARIQQQLDTVISSKPEATSVSAYQCSPQTSDALYDKMARLEKGMNHIMNIVGNQPQANTAPNIAAYQPYQREHNRSNSESDELQRLKEENRLLKLAQRGSPQQQSQQFQNHANYGSQDAFQERITNEMHRIQSRIDGFMRTYANRNNRQEQPRVRTREGRPVCDICGRVGHVRENCYARVDQRNQYHNPQNTQPRPQSGPRIAVLEAEGTAEQIVAQFEHQEPTNSAKSTCSTDIKSTYPEHNSTVTAKQSEHDAKSCEDLVSVTDSAENDTTENVIQNSRVQETAVTTTKEALASDSQTREPPAEEPSSTDNSYSTCAAEQVADTNIVIKPKDLSLFGTVADFPVKLLVDTGASITVLNGSLFRK